MSDTHSIHTQFDIAADHPSLAGHFPGNPVVPGVVILDHVRRSIEQWKRSSIDASKLKTVKFLSPVLMSDASSPLLTLVLEEMKISGRCETTKIDFRCMQDDELIVQGQWVFQADRPQ